MRIDVTAEHIRNGTKHTVSQCMVALALQDTLGVEYVCVGRHYADVSRRKGRGPYLTLCLPDFVCEAIDAFDAGDKVGSFAFEADIPEDWAKSPGVTA